ncbi:hypothetical protein HQQ80_21480 [Microbacteriaceae bacterium VKM Ac-2855]|nr:hypothetical protein [Microbacteriaceae bacterium VKM Ac-2855]
MRSATLLLLHGRNASPSTWAGLEWSDGSDVVTAEAPTVASVIATLESLQGPAVLIAEHDAALVSAEVHLRRPELVVAEIVIEPSYAQPDSAVPELSGRSRPTLGVFASEPAADIERNAGSADLVVWPGFSRDLHHDAPAAFVRTVERWLARV